MRVLLTDQTRPERTIVQELEARLLHGDLIIKQRKNAGIGVEELEHHWIQLLHEYEAAYREYQSAA